MADGTSNTPKLQFEDQVDKPSGPGTESKAQAPTATGDSGNVARAERAIGDPNDRPLDTDRTPHTREDNDRDLDRVRDAGRPELMSRDRVDSREAEARRTEPLGDKDAPQGTGRETNPNAGENRPEPLGEVRVSDREAGKEK